MTDIDIIDTSPEFETFARESALESPVFRERLWHERYEAVHPDVFEGYYATQDSRYRPPAMVRELSALRRQVGESAPALRHVIEEVDPLVRDLLGVASEPAPVHILMVGTGATNATVGRLRGRAAVYHCMEWSQSPAATGVLTAHEVTHAWHQILLGADPPATDLAWLTFSEGLAIQASRAAVPGRPEEEYFWYGLAGFGDWLPWCRERRDQLRERLRDGLDGSAEALLMFTGSAPDEPSRIGYFVADELVAGLGRPLRELVRMSVDEARSAVRDALGGHR